MILYWTDPETARRIVDIAASISRYAEANFCDKPMTANYSHTQPTLETLPEMAAAADAVKARVEGLAGHPGAYLRSMTRAFGTLVRYMGDPAYPYHEAVKDILEVDLQPIPEANFDALAAKIDLKLAEWGYTGPANQKIAAWQADRRIPAEEVTAVASRFLDKSRSFAAARVCALPPSEGIDSVNSIRGVYWSGLSEYLGDFQGRLTFNIDRPWNVPTFASILTHEGYPGHHTYYTLWDHLYQQGKLPMEAAFLPDRLADQLPV